MQVEGAGVRTRCKAQEFADKLVGSMQKCSVIASGEKRGGSKEEKRSFPV